MFGYNFTVQFIFVPPIAFEIIGRYWMHNGIERVIVFLGQPFFLVCYTIDYSLINGFVVDEIPSVISIKYTPAFREPT